jgi:hypothetical protein
MRLSWNRVRPRAARSSEEWKPAAAKYPRPDAGSVEFVNGDQRWIVCLGDVSPNELGAMPAVHERVGAVRASRLGSKNAVTRNLAEISTRYHVAAAPNRPFLVIPGSSSEKRDYVPIGWLRPPTIPRNCWGRRRADG